MKKIVVLDFDVSQCKDFCALLEGQNYPSLSARSFPQLEKQLTEHDCIGVFIDVDTIPVKDRDIRQLSMKYPGVHLFCLSKHRFHPELKDAICYHVYACLNRPIDPEELFYWLRSIYQDDKEPGE